MAPSDSDLSISLVVITLLVGLAYLARVRAKGEFPCERVDQERGADALRGVLRMGFWAIQPLARLLVALGISATRISWTSLVLGAGAGVFLAFGRFGWAAALATGAGLLDALDGTVARLTGTASKAGKILDSLLDRYVEFFFLGGLVVHYTRVPAFQVLTLLALLGSFMISYSTALPEIIGVRFETSSMRRAERLVYLTLGAALSPLVPASMALHPSLPTTLGYPMVLSLGIVALGANVSAARRLYGIARTAQRPRSDSSAASSARPVSLIRGLKPGPGTRGPDMKPIQRGSPHAPANPK